MLTNVPPERLAVLAHERPTLRPAIALAPLAHDGLLAWMAALGDPVVDAALTLRAAGLTPDADAQALYALGVAEPAARPAVALHARTPENLLRWFAQLGDPALDAALAVRPALLAALASADEMRTTTAPPPPVPAPAAVAVPTPVRAPTPASEPGPSPKPARAPKPRRAPGRPIARRRRNAVAAGVVVLVAALGTSGVFLVRHLLASEGAQIAFTSPSPTAAEESTEPADATTSGTPAPGASAPLGPPTDPTSPWWTLEVADIPDLTAGRRPLGYLAAPQSSEPPGIGIAHTPKQAGEFLLVATPVEDTDLDEPVMRVAMHDLTTGAELWARIMPTSTDCAIAPTTDLVFCGTSTQKDPDDNRSTTNVELTISASTGEVLGEWSADHPVLAVEHVDGYFVTLGVQEGELTLQRVSDRMVFSALFEAPNVAPDISSVAVDGTGLRFTDGEGRRWEWHPDSDGPPWLAEDWGVNLTFADGRTLVLTWDPSAYPDIVWLFGSPEDSDSASTTYAFDGWPLPRPVRVGGDEYVLLSNDDSSVVLDREGHEIARWNRGIRGARVMAGLPVLVSADGRTVTAIDPLTGENTWSVHLSGTAVLLEDAVLDVSPDGSGLSPTLTLYRPIPPDDAAIEAP